MTGELDGEPFTGEGLDGYAGPSLRFPNCSTQTLTFTMDAWDDANREVSVYGELRFSEIDGLRAGAPVLVGDFWYLGGPYRDPPEGGALLDVTVDMNDRTFWGVRNAEPIDARVVEVCDVPDGPCHTRVELEGHFTFEGRNELLGQRHDGVLSIGVDLERQIFAPDELGSPTIVEADSCRPPDGEGALRLAGDRLEIFHAGVWGSVCSEGFDADDARVACRQLGYPNGDWFPATSSHPIWMDDLACTGDEARLAECAFDGWGVRSCAPDSAVALRCY